MSRLFNLALTIVSALIFSGCQTTVKTESLGASDVAWESLFNGEDLSGWTVKAHSDDLKKTFFTVQDGAIVAQAMDKNHDYVWLYSDKQYADFHLQLKFQGDRGDYANSGVQIRSRYDHSDEGGWLNGPQVDVGFIERNGSMWDETRNNQRWLVERYDAKNFVFSDEGDGWNTLDIVARGTYVSVWQNGELISEYDGEGVLNDLNHQDLAVGMKGHLALQIHTKDVMKIKYKDIRIRDLSQSEKPLKVLVFSKTTGYFHPSINTIEKTIVELGEAHNWQVDLTRGSEIFTPEGLAKYDVVYWNNTCADYYIMSNDERAAFQRYVENGGGYAGIHGAAWVNFSPRWDWYIDTLLGAREINKNGNWEGVWRKAATIYGEIDGYMTEMIPDGYQLTDEYYSMSRDVRQPQPEQSPDDQIQILISAIADWDYGDFRTGHPVTWRRHIKAGRMWYSAIGHNHETIIDPVFKAHMKEGIEWAAGIGDDI